MPEITQLLSGGTEIQIQHLTHLTSEQHCLPCEWLISRASSTFGCWHLSIYVSQNQWWQLTLARIFLLSSSSCACFPPSRLLDGEAMFCSVPIYLPSPQTWWDFHAQPHLTHGGAHMLPIVWMYDIPSHMVFTHLTSLHSHIPNKSINALRNRYSGVQLEIKWNIS